MQKFKIIVVVSLFTACFLYVETSFAQNSTDQPNFIIIFTDDQGYGDVGVFGHPTIKTPNLDNMAFEGQKWTNFYVGANVCTPSRSSLLTGRLPVRNGMYGRVRRVFFPDSPSGLQTTEITIAKLLKKKNYSTGIIGKWHLGHLPEYLPMNHGFDSYFGIPYSNDMDRVNDGNLFEFVWEPSIDKFNVPLMRNEEIIERPADQTTITKRYTEESQKFIRENKNKPFFLYLAHSLPHVPLFASGDFIGTSERGLYGDVIEEIDWSVGEILKTLKEEGLEKNTYVVFTSDNGPWAIFNEMAGESGHLFGSKGTSYEGGVRVPTIIWGPGNVEPGVVSKIGSTLDILPTFSKLAGVEIPVDRVIDGYDLTGILKGENINPRKEMFYYHDDILFAVRKNEYKLIFYKNNPNGYPHNVEKLDKPSLFNLSHDPGEKYDISEKFPEKVKELSDFANDHKASFELSESELDKGFSK